MPLNESEGYRRINPLAPKENRKPISREQKALMIESLYGRKREEEMPYTLPKPEQQQAADDGAVLTALGLNPDQIEVLRRALGVLPKANMKPPIAFDINEPPPPPVPKGGWPTIPCIVHRLNPKTNQNESKICYTAQERDLALENGWHKQRQAVIEVDTDPDLSESELIAAYRQDREAKKQKASQMVGDEPEPKRRGPGRPPGSGHHKEDDPAA